MTSDVEALPFLDSNSSPDLFHGSEKRLYRIEARQILGEVRYRKLGSLVVNEDVALFE